MRARIGIEPWRARGRGKAYARDSYCLGIVTGLKGEETCCGTCPSGIYPGRAEDNEQDHYYDQTNTRSQASHDMLPYMIK
jgi:hypothetical protein